MKTGTGVLSFRLIAVLLLGASPAISAEAPAGYERGPAGDEEHLHFAAVNGVKLAYRIEGAGVPVIFVHGEGYSHELWTEQIDAFSEDYLFLSYDRRGHGLSEDPITGYSETAHAEDLNSLMKYFGMREAHLVANSRGGSIVIRFLTMYPDKVRSLTFADATIPVIEVPEDSVFYSVVPALKAPPPSLKEALQGRERAKKSSFTKVAQSREETNAVLQRMVDQYSPRVAMNPQRSDMASATHIGPWNRRDFPDMSKMHQPILLVVGELTDVLFIEAAAEANRLWPNTRHEMIPGTDHLLMLEAPERFNSLVLDFLADVDRVILERNRRVGQVPVVP
ncbi:MAG TPA: alpha/beta hydrolase [Woeseiaceae bacterium]|nr:alpha/beta hydrolase [Woeseiaceae bacterium]